MRKLIVIIPIVIIAFVILEIIYLNTDKDINIDIQKLGEELVNSKIFEDSLSQVDKDSIIKKYNFDSQKIKDINSYVGTGATAEEILIIELIKKDDKNVIT